MNQKGALTLLPGELSVKQPAKDGKAYLEYRRAQARAHYRANKERHLAQRLTLL